MRPALKKWQKKDSLSISNTFKVYTHAHILYHHTSSGALFSRDTTVAYFFLLEDMHVSFRANNVWITELRTISSCVSNALHRNINMRHENEPNMRLYYVWFLVYVCASEWNVCSWSYIYIRSYKLCNGFSYRLEQSIFIEIFRTPQKKRPNTRFNTMWEYILLSCIQIVSFLLHKLLRIGGWWSSEIATIERIIQCGRHAAWKFG